MGAAGGGVAERSVAGGKGGNVERRCVDCWHTMNYRPFKFTLSHFAQMGMSLDLKHRLPIYHLIN